MHKKISLSVSSFLLTGLFVTGCSQQQIHGGNHSAGGQQVAGGQQAYGNSSAPTAIDTQTTPTITPTAIDNQMQDVVVPQTPKVMPVQKRQPMVRPIQRQRMVKPVQRMAKPIQRQHVSYTESLEAILPPAVPNQCYAKIRTDPKFKNVIKRIQVSPAVNKRVLVRGPQYAYTSEQVQVRPATQVHQYIPAQYKNITKRILVKPAHYAWQKGKKGPITRIDKMTGEILCRVKVPAVYRTVVQKVVVRPGHRVTKHVPAVYQTVERKVLASPAQYKNVHQPARFVNKTYKVQSSGAGYRWQPIDC